MKYDQKPLFGRYFGSFKCDEVSLSDTQNLCFLSLNSSEVDRIQTNPEPHFRLSILDPGC